jgi:hypothetical protein
MGRELKRVPLDFNWPKNQAWKGFINPIHSQQCKPCDGSGCSKDAKRMQDEWYGFDLPQRVGRQDKAWQYNLSHEDVQALLDAERLWDFTRIPRTEDQKDKSAQHPNGWLKESNGYVPTPEEVNEWAKRGIGHDSCNSSVCIEARCKRENKIYLCEFCNGDGAIWQSPEIEKMHNDWQRFEPPTGDGFQLWETTSEGSPVSPVFKTLDELCEWCEDGASTFGSQRTTKEQWKKMLDDNFVIHREGNNVFI